MSEPNQKTFMSNSEIHLLKFHTEEKLLNTDKDLYTKVFFAEWFIIARHYEELYDREFTR